MPERNRFRSATGIALAVWIIAISCVSGAAAWTRHDYGDVLAWAESVLFILGTLIGAVGLGAELDKPRRP
jgi:hypothetical protein